MIVRVTGTLETVAQNAAVVALADGCAREVLVPAAAMGELAMAVGGSVTLHTVEVYEGSAQGAHLTPRLIGFLTDRDRRFFALFTTVKGIGPRKALRAMAEPTGSIARAICARDAKALTALPEVGKRLAETIIAELSGRAEAFADAPGAGETGVPPGGTGADAARALSGPAERAIAALVRLGESRADAEAMVARAAGSMSADADADALLAAAFSLRS